MNNEFDLIIVGAGLVGASFILALQQQGLKIAVLEKQVPEFATGATESFRPISLAYGSMKIMAMLGVWDTLAAAATPITEVVVCEERSLGAVHFTARELKVDALGYVLSHFDLYRSIYQKAVQQTGVELINLQDIIRLERIDEKMQVLISTAEGQRELYAPLVIGCDGTSSSVRKLLAIEADEESSQEVAMTAVLTLEKPYGGTALERFSREGILALLPLPSPERCGMVFTLPKKIWQARKEWSSSEWITALTAQLSPRLPKILHIEQGGVFPLQTMVAKQQVAPGVILLGNAAHTIYPLAAQGFNLGLRDAAALAEVLVTAKQQLQPLDDPKILQQYVDSRSRDQARIIRLTKSIVRSANLQFPGASALRGVGLLTLDLLAPAKKRLAKMAMGLSGSLPKLMRGLPLWESSEHHE